MSSLLRSLERRNTVCIVSYRVSIASCIASIRSCRAFCTCRNSQHMYQDSAHVMIEPTLVTRDTCCDAEPLGPTPEAACRRTSRHVAKRRHVASDGRRAAHVAHVASPNTYTSRDMAHSAPRLGRRRHGRLDVCDEHLEICLLF